MDCERGTECCTPNLPESLLAVRREVEPRADGAVAAASQQELDQHLPSRTRSPNQASAVAGARLAPRRDPAGEHGRLTAGALRAAANRARRCVDRRRRQVIY